MCRVEIESVTLRDIGVDLSVIPSRRGQGPLPDLEVTLNGLSLRTSIKI